MDKLREVWDYFKDDKQTLPDVADVSRSQLDEKDRPPGECWACNRFAKGALIHESPGYAKCCRDCDAYAGHEVI